MANTVFYPANPRFQNTPFAAPDCATSDSLRTGKLFETEFLRACRKVGRMERLEDDRYNKPSCDHFAVYPSPSHSSGPPLPGMLTFFECKSTGCANLPMVDIKSHQQEAMARYDHAFHGSYAGFVIHFRGGSEEEVWYMPGKAVREYLDKNPEARYLPTEFVKRRGLPIGISKERPKARLGERLEVGDFLVQLSET